MKLINEDCLGIILKLPKHSVDMVFADLPYGSTGCEWDEPIHLGVLWTLLLRAAKPNAAFVFTAQQPFTSELVISQKNLFKHELIWEKPNGTNPFQANYMPMKKHESVVVFGRGKITYNPQMVEGTPYKWNGTRTKGEAGGVVQLRPTPIENKGTRYPGSVLRFPQERGLHPTQKPVPLMEWIIKTYSNPGDVVLDPTMGSGTTGLATIRNGRDFIGIEGNEAYFKIAYERLMAEQQQLAA